MKTDEDHALAIGEAQKKLNDLMRQAVENGLRVEIEINQFQAVNLRHSRPSIDCVVSRVIS